MLKAALLSIELLVKFQIPLQKKMDEYLDFKNRFKLFTSKNKSLLTVTLSNIFTMRLIGNKTHGDLAEIGIVEFINQFMYDYSSVHVGKDLFRAKESEEDIIIINELNGTKFPVSLKAYGDGPLQLSTDKNMILYPYLDSLNLSSEQTTLEIEEIFNSEAFKDFGTMHVMPLIYDEKNKRCNIMIFNYHSAISNTRFIRKIDKGNGRKHPAYIFTDENGAYICEVRYGGATANALQRGLWTNTKRAHLYFDSLTNGWIDYSHNLTLVKLFGLALVANEDAHTTANVILQQQITELKNTL